MPARARSQAARRPLISTTDDRGVAFGANGNWRERFDKPGLGNPRGNQANCLLRSALWSGFAAPTDLLSDVDVFVKERVLACTGDRLAKSVLVKTGCACGNYHAIYCLTT